MEDILFEILVVVVVIVAVIIWFFSFNSPKRIGTRGEARVARQLNKLKDDEYKVFNDILIKTSKGSTQVDHVVISIYGIFVIETKNFSGWIHGHEKSEYWTQSIYRHKTKFRNPIKQNWAHIYALKEILSEFDHIVYHPIIVFSGNAELKNVSSEIPVIYYEHLIQTIMAKRETPILSIEQVKNIADKLNSINIQDKKAQKEHIYNVRNNAFEREKKERALICPNCGGNLLVRDGKYGEFYGCSNYPKCKYTLNS